MVIGIQHYYIAQDYIFLDASNSRSMNTSEALQPFVSPSTASHFPTTVEAHHQNPIKEIELNQADVQILQSVPCIGPKRAQAIVAYRSQLPEQKFHSLQQLLEIKGINRKILDRISTYFIL